MKIDFEKFLNPRIEKHCLPLYRGGHFKHAALEAMTQVELALKDKVETEGIEEKRFGVFLVTNLFGKDKPSIKLRVPLGEDLQSEAEMLFKGAFKYYRNYCAHDGSKVDENQCLRIMVLGSELLDLIGASSLSFEDVGGVDGLVRVGAFTGRNELVGLLKILDGYTLPDEVIDGFYDDLYDRGFSPVQLDAVIDLDLVFFRVEDYLPSQEELMGRIPPPLTVAWFELTDLGKKVVGASDQ